MILDNLEKIKSSYDICIIGAGASGLVISEKLSKKYKILIIEGGSFDISEIIIFYIMINIILQIFMMMEEVFIF